MTESPVCPSCGMSTWWEGRCWNPWCDAAEDAEDGIEPEDDHD